MRPSAPYTSGAFLPLLILLASIALAQPTSVPTVTMTFDFPGSEPEHFVAVVSSDGHTLYDSNGKLTPQSEAGEPFRLEFVMSKATCDRIFNLAKKAHYFDREVDSKAANLAFMGKKVLSYESGSRKTQVTYNYSTLPAVQELTGLFQDLSATLEFGRRLDYYHHYQKLALDEELTSMEVMLREKNLVELPAVAPILRTIANDSSVMNVSRARALRVLSQASGVAAR